MLRYAIGFLNVLIEVQYKVDIYFTAVGLIGIPKEEEILAMTEVIKKDPQKFRISA